MPFLVFDEIEKETVTPKYSTAYGELVTGEYIEVGRLNFKAGEGAVSTQHPHEQVMYIISGSSRSTSKASTPSSARHGLPREAEPEAQGAGDRGHPGHQRKHVIEGVGHKI